MMNRNDLRRADISLLIVFETMMHERNVSRVGEKMFLGQPAISAALGRLRHLFNDPLFIRTGRLMEPTSRAKEIYSNLTPALDSIAAALSRSQVFNPKTSEATFYIGLSDDVEYALLPYLLSRMRIEAPNVTFVVRRADQWHLPQLLVSGEVSLGISYALQLPANARCKCLLPIRPMLLRADSQPDELDLDSFCSRPHAVVSSMGNLIEDADRALHLIGRQRKVILAVPQFSALPVLLAGSDMIAIVPDYVARAMSGSGGLRAEAVPISLPQHELSMVWSGATHKDPGEHWLRSQCSAFLGNAPEEPAELKSLGVNISAVA